jgi:hypothetical protein
VVGFPLSKQKARKKRSLKKVFQYGNRHTIYSVQAEHYKQYIVYAHAVG